MHVRLASLFVVLAFAASAAPAAHAADAPAGVRMLSCDAVDGAGGRSRYVARMDARARHAPDVRFASGCSRRPATASSSASPRRASACGGSPARARRPSTGSTTSRACSHGAIYRVVVRYRWYDADGRADPHRAPALRRRAASRRACRTCASRRSTTEPGEVEGTAVYKVTIVNRGAAAGAERRRPAARRRRDRGRGRGDRHARAGRDSNGHLQRPRLPSQRCAWSSIRKS